MHSFTIRRLLILLAVTVTCCAGCGGGGGGGGIPTPPTPPPVTSLSLQVQAPDVTGKVGQQVSIPIKVAGPGTVTTFTTDISVSDAAFEPVAGLGMSREISGLPDTSAASYKWVNSQTIRVIYVSATGATSGSTVVSIPVRVKAEAASTPTLRNTRINQ